MHRHRFRRPLGRGSRSAGDRFIRFALIALLGPITPVLTLLACLGLWSQALRGPYFLACVLVFFGVAHAYDDLPSRRAPHRPTAFHLLADITLRWCVLVAFIWLVIRLSELHYTVNPTLFWTWAVLTPLALWLAEGVTQQLRHGARGNRKGMLSSGRPRLGRRRAADQVIKGAKRSPGAIAHGDDDLFERRGGDIAGSEHARQ